MSGISVQKAGFKMNQSASQTFNSKHFISAEFVGKGTLGKMVGKMELLSLGKVVR